MSSLLLSINPKFVDRIISGDKQFEYRKFKCREDVEHIVIYSTSPMQRVVAEARIEYVVEGPVPDVWERTKDYSGIDKEFYYSYYKNKDHAYAYRLSDVTVYSRPKTLGEIGVKYPPQSYCYI